MSTSLPFDMKYSAIAVPEYGDIYWNGAGSLAEGLQALSAGMDQLAQGTAALDENSPALTGGADALAQGLDELSAGTDTLSSGTSVLAGNSEALTGGADQLASGVLTLAEGMDEILSGSLELKDGCVQFNEEGIQKIADFYKEDVKDLDARVRELRNAAREYTTFSGAASDMNCTVKFIIKADSIA